MSNIKLVNVDTLETDLTDIANSIRSKTNTSSTYSISDMAQAISDIPTGIGIDDIATNNYDIQTLNLNTTYILPYAFQGITSITTVNAPNVTHFGRTVGGAGSYIFNDCTGITSINFPVLSNMGTGGHQFQGCTNLTSVFFPKISGPGTHAFENCSNLITAVCAGNSSTMNQGTFTNCIKLKSVDTTTTKVHNTEFSGCTTFDTLILRYTKIATLGNINAFTNSPFASGGTGGTLYVPQALISDYQSATNWSTILGYENNNIVAIEGSQYENYYANGTPISN